MRRPTTTAPDDPGDFTYAVTDGIAPVNGTVDIVLNPVNDAPVAQDDAVAVTEDGPAATGNVLADNGNGADSDVEGDTLTVTAVNSSGGNVGSQITLASGALLTVNGDGTYSYDPNGAFEYLGAGDSASDSFSYTVSDGNGGFDTATVTIIVNGSNDAPIAQDDTVSAGEDGPAATGSVLADNGNGIDSDVEGDTLTVTAVNGSGGNVGSQIILASGALLTVNGDGTYSYDPNGQFEYLGAGESDTDSFSYTVSDGNGGFDTATVTINVNGTNEAPVAVTASAVESYYNGLIWCGLWSHADVVAGSVLIDRFEVSDADINDTHVFTIVDGSGTPVIDPDLEIVNGQLVVKAGNTLTEDVVTTKSVIIRVDDGNGGTFDYSYTLDIQLQPGGANNGSSGRDFAAGTNVADVMYGGLGTDRMFAYDGDDILNGGDGEDILDGGAGADTLNGGNGDDAAAYISSITGITADLANTAANTGDAMGDVYINIEGLWGSNFDDQLFGDAGDNVLIGGAGDDLLDGRAGNDKLQGGYGNDTFVMADGYGYDRIFGFEAGAGTPDIVDITAFGFSDFADVQAAAYVSGNYVIVQLDADDSVGFYGLNNINQLHQDDFLI